ncbi:MAG: hypothetical protein U0790_11455 [Isosphaeraceae bacterium]
MEHQVPHFESDASRLVLLPILGLLGGLGLGALRAWLNRASFPEAVVDPLTGAIVGSAVGMLAVLALAVPVRKWRIRSVRSIALLGLFSGFLLWFAATFLRAVLLSLLH